MRRLKYNHGRWQTERERCRIEEEHPAAPGGAAVSISRIIPQLMTRLGMEEGVWLRTLEQEWVSLVGETLARHARPGRYRQGCLVVYVDSPVWLNELKRYGKKEIQGVLEGRFGAKVGKVVLEPDPGA